LRIPRVNGTGCYLRVDVSLVFFSTDEQISHPVYFVLHSCSYF
jgi:hypothetical protein